MAKKKSLDITKTGPLNYIQLQRANQQMTPEEIEAEDKLYKDLGFDFTPVSAYDPIRNYEGYEQSPLANTNKPFGASKFDPQVLSSDEFYRLGDIRAEEQTGLGKIANGLAKGVILAGTTFLDGTVGIAAGLATAIREDRWSGLWDNDFSRAMQAINEQSEEWLPNYYSQREQESPWYENIFTANFIGDKFIKNLGFTVGAYYSGNVWAKGLQATKLPQLVGKAGMSGATKAVNAAKQTGSAEQLASAIAQVGRAVDAPAHVVSGVGAVLSAVNEGRIEALNNSKDWYNLEKMKIDDYYSPLFEQAKEEYDSTKGGLEAVMHPDEQIDYVDPAYEKYTNRVAELRDAYEQSMAKLNEDRLKMGNADLLMNIPILTASNIIQFGRLYGNGYKTARKAVNVVNKGKYAGKSLQEAMAIAETEGLSIDQFAKEFARFGAKEAKSGIVGGLSRFGRNMMTTAVPEGLEEISQKAASTVAGDYYDMDVHNFYRKKVDPEASQETLDWMKAFAQGINETVNEGSSWEEFFIGALTGALGMPVFGKASTSASDTYLGKGKALGLRGGIIGAGKEARAQRARDEKVANYINSRILSPEFKNYYQGLVRHQAYQNDMNTAAINGDELLYKNAEHAQLISDIMMFDNAGKIGDLLTLVNSAYDTSEENLASIIKNTTSVQTVAGKKQLVGPFAEYATLDASGNVVSNFGSQERQKEMSDKISRNREDILDAISDYQLAKDEIDILTGQRLSDEQLQELTWIKTQSKNWNERGQSIVKDRVRGVLTSLVGDINARRDDAANAKREEGASHIERTKLYDVFSAVERTQQQYLDALHELLGLNDEELFMVLSHDVSAQNREGLAKLVDLSPTISPTDAASFKTALNDIVTLREGITSFNDKLNEYLKNPEKQAEELAQEDTKTVNTEINNKRSAIARRINFNAPTSEIAKALAENKDDIDAMGGIDEFIKTLSVAEQDKVKRAQRFAKGMVSFRNAIDSADLTSEQRRIANKIIDDNTAGVDNIVELGNRISKAVDNGAVREEMAKSVSTMEGINDLAFETNLSETEGKLKDLFEDKIKEVAAALSSLEKADSDKLEKAAEALRKEEAAASPEERVPEDKTQTSPDELMLLNQKTISDLRAQFKGGIPIADKGKPEATELFKALSNPNLTSSKNGSTKNKRAAVRKLLALAKKYPDLEMSKAILERAKQSVPKEPRATDAFSPEASDKNASTSEKEVKSKNKEIKFPVAGTGDAAYHSRPQISQNYLHGRNGLTYPAYLEAALADPANPEYKDAFPKGVDKEAYVKYIRAVWNYLNEHNAFSYVAGLNPENRLEAGDVIVFSTDSKLDSEAGVPVAIMTTKNGQVIGTLPTSIDFNAINRRYNKPEGEVRPGQKALYEEVIKRSKEMGAVLLSTEVNALRGGRIEFGSNEFSVSEVFNDSVPVIAVLNESNQLTTGSKELDARLISPSVISSQVVPWSIYAMVPANTGEYLPALCYSTKLSDIIDDPNDWYIAQTVAAIQKVPERISELKDNIKAVYKWIPVPGLSISIGSKRSDGTWAKETADISNAKFVRITYSKPGKSDGRPQEKYIPIEDGKVSESEVRTKLAEIIKRDYPDMTTNVDIKKLTNSADHQEYRRNISKYLFTNILGPHTVNDWFTYTPTEIEQRTALREKDTKEEKKPAVQRGPEWQEVVVDGNTYYVNGDVIEDSEGSLASLSAEQQKQIKEALAVPEVENPVTDPQRKSFIAFDTGGEVRIGSREQALRARRKRGQGKNLRTTDTSEESASTERIYENIEKVRQMFPQLSDMDRVIVVNGLIKTVDEQGNPIEAYGHFRDGVLYISSQSPEGTAYHEAFHYVTDMLLNDADRNILFKEAKDRYGDFSEIELEEKLAEDFRDFMNGFDDTSLVGRLRSFFRNLRHLVKSLIGRETYLDNLFFDIYKNKYNHQKEVYSPEVDPFERQFIQYQNNKLSYNNLDTSTKEALKAKKVTEDEYDDLNTEDKENVTFCLL